MRYIFARLAGLAGLAAALVLAEAGPVSAQAAPGGTQELRLADAQVERIRRYFAGRSVADLRVAPDGVAAEVGKPIPQDVRIEPLPGAILADLPAGVDYQYFMRGDDLVIVDAGTRVVVAVIRNGG